MNRYSKRVKSLLLVFLSIVVTLLGFALGGCAKLQPYVHDLDNYLDWSTARTNNSTGV